MALSQSYPSGTNLKAWVLRQCVMRTLVRLGKSSSGIEEILVIIELARRLWLSGTQGKAPRLRRQITLANQVGVLVALATAPYQAFYSLYDPAQYRDMITLNFLFMIIYLSVVVLNHRGNHTGARNVLLANTCAQAFITAWIVGAAAGAQLFYFAIGCYLALAFDRARDRRLVCQLGVIVALFLASHSLFTPARALTPLPSDILEVMYLVNATAVLVLCAAIAFLFRHEIDCTEQELTLTNRKLSELSTTDMLTGLANRRRLDSVLSRSCRRLERRFQPLSLIMCDVDHFKLYNDRLGHPAGDRCLQQVAGALRRTLFRKEHLVARYGGEEFAIVLANTDRNGALDIAERLRKAVRELRLAHPASPDLPLLTVSLGVTTLASPTPGVLPCQLIQQADEALYLAKANGRNRVEYLALEQALAEDLDESDLLPEPRALAL